MSNRCHAAKLRAAVLFVFFAVAIATHAQIQKAWEARYNNEGTQVSSYDFSGTIVITNGFMYTLGIGASGIQTVKYTTNGTSLWAAYYRGTSTTPDAAGDIAIDMGGNVYVTGRSVDPSGLYWESVTVKYDALGNQLWADRYSRTNAYHAGNSIALDTNGNAYVAGVATPYYLLIKYSPEGARQWTILQTNSPPYEIAGGYTGVALDVQGAIYVTGNGSGASRTAKYDSAGGELWSVNYGSYGGQSIALDTTANVYSVGSAILKYSKNGELLWARTNVPVGYVKIGSSGSVYGAGLGSAMWTCKYSSAGTLLWSNVIGYSVPVGYFAHVRQNPLVIDTNESVYVTGPTASTGNGVYNYTTVKYSSGGVRLWGSDYNGLANGQDLSTAIALDAFGDVYVTGGADETNWGADVTTIKYSKTDGSVLWITRFDGRANGQHRAVTLAEDNAGNVYVGGNSPGTNGWSQCALVKYHRNGTKFWSARYGNIPFSHSQFGGMALDQSGNVIVTGGGGTAKYDSSGTLLWARDYRAKAAGVDGTGAIFLTGFSNSVAATAKLDENGTQVWLKTHPIQPSVGLVVDHQGNVVVVAPIKLSCNRMECFYSFYVLKYDTYGNLLWQLQYGGPSSQVLMIKGIQMDSEDNIYVTGQMVYDQHLTVKINPAGTVQYYAGSRWPLFGMTAFAVDRLGNACLGGARGYSGGATKLLKISTTGSQLWEIQETQTMLKETISGIAIDEAFNIYLTGSTAASGAGLNLVTTKLDSNGNRMWTVGHDGSAHRNDEGTAIMVAQGGSVYVAGYETTAGDGSDFITLKYSSLQNVQPFSDGTRLIQFFGMPGRHYDFHASEDLSTNWQRIGSATADDEGIVGHLDTAAGKFSKRFYKLVSP